MGIRKILSLAGLISMLAVQTVQAQEGEVTVVVENKQNNSTGLQQEDVDQWFNIADCQDDIEVTFEVEVVGVDNLDPLRLFEGSSCASSAGCNEIGDTIERTSNFDDIRADITVNLSDIFPDEDECSSAGDDQEDNRVWAAVIEDVNTVDDGVWSEPLQVIIDLFPPPKPTEVEAQFGEESIEVKWDADNDDLTHPLDGAGETETDTDTDSDTDTEADDSSTPGDETLVSGMFYIIYEACGVAVAPETGDTTDTDASPFTDTDADADGGDGDQAVNCSDLCEDVGFVEDGTNFGDFSFVEANSSARSATIKNLTNGTAYKVAVVSFDAFMNPSKISNWDCAIPGETTSFLEAYSEAGGKGAGNFCFVATAAFGSYDHPTVRVLRQFRDGFLSGIFGGEQFVDFYYAVGPKLAGLLDGRPRLAAGTRGALRAFSPVAAGLTKMGPKSFNLSLLLLCCSVVAMIVVRRRRRRR